MEIERLGENKIRCIKYFWIAKHRKDVLEGNTYGN